MDRQESYQDINPVVSDEYVAMGELGQVHERMPPRTNGSSVSPTDSHGSMYHSLNMSASIGYEGPPLNLYDEHSSRYSTHAAHAAQWLHSQAYFPPPPAAESSGDPAESPSSNGTYEGQMMDAPTGDWQNIFMQSMGV